MATVQAVQPWTRPVAAAMPSATVVSGRGQIEIGDRTTEVGPDGAVYIPPTASHALECVGTEPLVFAFTFPRDRFDQIVYCPDH